MLGERDVRIADDVAREGLLEDALRTLQGKLIQDQALKTRLALCTDLPSPPGIAVQILQLGEDPGVSIADVADVVQLDPALTAKIMRIANSPMYARRRKPENLRQALMLLGLNATMTLALSFSLVKSLRSEKQDGLDYRYFWKRSITTAAFCRVLAEKMRIMPTEDLFLGGLLQGIGILAVDRMAPELYSSVGDAQYNWAMLRKQEKETLGADHAMIGGYLLAHWNFPEALVYGVGFVSERPAEVPADYENIAKISSAGGWLTDVLLNHDVETALADAAAGISADTGLQQEAITEVVESALHETREFGALFEIDVGEPDYLEAITARAKEVLMIRSLQNLQETAALEESKIHLESKTRELEEKSNRDALTGLYNRAFFDQSIQNEFDFATTNGTPLTIAFIDLDHFKSINDTHGHQTGDEILKGTSQLLLKSTRYGDIAARYGGEEFVLIFPGTGYVGARVAIGRLLGLFQNTNHEISESKSLSVTASIGVAVHNDGTSRFASAEALLRAADRAVYTAKRNGRNRICYYEEE